MNEKKPKFDISVWLLISAAIFIVLFFLWYFFIYVNGQEKLQVQKDFRALTQIGENFKSRYESYISIIKSDYLQERLREETKELTDTIIILKKQTEALNSIRSKFRPLLKDIFYYKENKSDSVFQSLDTLQGLVNDLRNLHKKNSFIDSVGKQQLYDQINTTIREDFAGLELAGENSKDDRYIYFGSGDYLSDTSGIPTPEKVFYRMEKATFFKPIERKDIFEEFLIIKRDKKDEFFYSSFPGDLEVNVLDSLIKFSRGISSGITADAKISGIDYKLFLTSFDLQNGNKYFIGGLIDKDKYVKEIRSINYFLALIIVIVFIIFLLSIPLFKLKMTGESQQFKIADLVLSNLSIILGTSFIVLVILSILGYSRTMNKVDLSLEDLSHKIKKNFVDEIERINNTLDLFVSDSLIVKGKFDTTKYPRINLINLINSDTIRLSDSSNFHFNDTTHFRLTDTNLTDLSKFKPDSVLFVRSNDKNFVRYNNTDSSYIKLKDTAYTLNDSVYLRLDDSAYHYFKLIFNLDNDGNQINIISSRQIESPKENYSYRNYFKESGEWELNGKKIMLDFIFSSTSGEQLGVVSKRSGNEVYVITSRLYSVINTIMPPGYGFCIVDSKGDVKFHSDPEKMLRENFLAETDNSDQLASAIYSNDKAFFSGKYLGKSHSFYIQPIRTLPLYLVTFYDNTYSNSVNVQVTSNVVLFSIILLMMFFILLFGFRLINFRKSGLKRSFDIVKFLRPDRYKSPLYKRMLTSNIAAIFLILISCWLTNTATLICLIYLYVVIQLCAVNCRAKYEIRKENKEKEYSYRYGIIAGIIITIIYYIAFKINVEIFYLTGFAVILMITDYYILVKLSISAKKGSIFNLDKSDPKLFYHYLFSWLSLVVITPIIVFFIIFYNYETELDLGHTLYMYAKDEAVRTYNIDKFYHDRIKKSFHFFRKDREKEGIYKIDTSIYSSRNKIDTSLTTVLNKLRSENNADTSLVKLLNDYKYKSKRDSFPVNSLNNLIIYFKAGVDPLSRERRSLIKQNSNDVFIEPSGQVFVDFRMRQTHYSAAKDSPNLYYIGKAYKFGFNKPEVFILSLLAILAILFVIWKLIQFISDRMFDLSFEVEREFKYLYPLHKISGNNIIIQLSSSFDDFVGRYESKPLPPILDYKTMEPNQFASLTENAPKIFIKNVDPDFRHPGKDVDKLTEISKIGEREKCQLILIIGQGIEKLIEKCESRIKSENYDDSSQTLKKLKSILELMDKNYNHLYTPVIGIENREIKDYLNNRLDEVNLPKNIKLSEEVKKTIINELSVLGIPTDAIKNYSEPIIIYAVQNSGSKILREKIILMVQEIAKSYYEKIWAACTDEEKLVLDDISDSLLLNSENKRTIKILMAKGFLKKNISVGIVNDSFRNFVNTKKESDLEKEYLKVRKSGNWAKYRAPLLLILAAIAFFIVLQENVFPNFYSMLTVMLGILTAIGKISGLFSSGNTFKPTTAESK